jgi:hypothetical protein
MESDLIDFIRSARGPFPLSVAASELERLGKAGAGWPTATATHWQRELEALVSKGLLTMADGMMSVPKSTTVKQPTLFD